MGCDRRTETDTVNGVTYHERQPAPNHCPGTRRLDIQRAATRAATIPTDRLGPMILAQLREWKLARFNDVSRKL